jgi:cell shape-determining protein MreD
VSQPIGWVPSEVERTGRAPTGRKAWAAFGCGIAGGFFLGALIDWDSEAYGGRVIGVIVAMPLFLLASFGLVIQIRQRVRASVVSCLALLAASIGAGFQWARAMSYEITGPPPQDMSKAVESSYGRSAMVLLPIAIAVAVYFSLRHFPVRAEPRSTDNPISPTM